MEMQQLVMRAVWLITALCSIHVGAIALGYDFCAPWHRYMKYVDIVFGVAGVMSLIFFFMY